jgi:hypothetical protein
VAGVIDWPGWCRIGRRPDDALALLETTRPRYARVVERALELAGATSGGAARRDAWPSLDGSLAVIEELAGNATTAFGAPALSPAGDDRPIDEAELDRLSAILIASWSAFDGARASAAGLELRKGPRGGGRDLAAIAEHVAEAERAYAVKLGVRAPKTAAGLHEAILGGLAARVGGEPVADPSAARARWLPRYFVRRSAWHALDHAWEIEDRAIPDDAGGHGP